MDFTCDPALKDVQFCCDFVFAWFHLWCLKQNVEALILQSIVPEVVNNAMRLLKMVAERGAALAETGRIIMADYREDCQAIRLKLGAFVETFGENISKTFCLNLEQYDNKGVSYRSPKITVPVSPQQLLGKEDLEAVKTRAWSNLSCFPIIVTSVTTDVVIDSL